MTFSWGSEHMCAWEWEDSDSNWEERKKMRRKIEDRGQCSAEEEEFSTDLLYQNMRTRNAFSDFVYFVFLRCSLWCKHLIVIYINQRAYCKKPAKAPANMAFPSHSDQRKQYNAKIRQQFNTEIKLQYNTQGCKDQHNSLFNKNRNGVLILLQFDLLDMQFSELVAYPSPSASVM